MSNVMYFDWKLNRMKIFDEQLGPFFLMCVIKEVKIRKKKKHTTGTQYSYTCIKNRFRTSSTSFILMIPFTENK